MKENKRCGGVVGLVTCEWKRWNGGCDSCPVRQATQQKSIDQTLVEEQRAESANRLIGPSDQS